MNQETATLDPEGDFTGFYLNEILNAAILRHAPAFESLDMHEYAVLLEKMTALAYDAQDRQKQTQNFTQAHEFETYLSGLWSSFLDQGWFSTFSPQEFGGHGLPETLSAPLMAQIFLMDPVFAVLAISSIEMGNLIKSLGSPEIKKEFAKPVFSGEWLAVPAVSESAFCMNPKPVMTTAEPEKDYYVIQGEKCYVPGAGYGFTKKIVFLVSATIPGGKKKKSETGWFIVPSHLDEGNETTDNHVAITKQHVGSHLKGLFPCDLSFGKQGKTIGYLLPNSIKKSGSLAVLDRLLYKLNFFDPLLSKQALEYLTGFVTDQLSAADTKASFWNRVYYPNASDSVIQLSAVYHGIHAALMTTAFYSDWSEHGAEAKRDNFSGLFSLFARCMRSYSKKKCLESFHNMEKSMGALAYGEESPLPYLLGASHTNLFGYESAAEAGEVLITSILSNNNRKALNNLLLEFNELDAHKATSESLREAIGVWKDYQGGLFVLMDNYSSPEKGKLAPKDLFYEDILMLVGDLIVACQLIRLALYAEKVLKELGLNFFNLEIEIEKNPQLWKWYNMLVTAEYFCLTQLSRQEGMIHIFNRTPASALDFKLFKPDKG